MILKNPEKLKLRSECTPVGIKMISQSAIKRSSLDLGYFPAKHIQDVIAGSGKPGEPAASTL